MHDMVGAPPTDQDEVRFFAASLARDPDGVDLAYRVLDHVADRYGLSDACLVLRPDLLGSQIFCRGRVPVALEAVADLLSRPVGLYGSAAPFDPGIGSALAGICNLALSAHVARRASAVDPIDGLLSRWALDGSLARAAACADRYGWPFTAVLLTTDGEEPPQERWLALTAALRAALRVGDEAGVAAPGFAFALLGNAGPDVVRPFVARVRAALSAVGAEGLDLFVATASAPAESVDPEELRRLAGERLIELRGHAEPGATTWPDTQPAAVWPGHMPPELELELRSLPGVVSVGTTARATGTGPQVSVVAGRTSDALHAAVLARSRAMIGDPSGVSVVVTTVPEGGSVDPGTPPTPDEPSGGAGPRDAVEAPENPPATRVIDIPETQFDPETDADADGATFGTNGWMRHSVTALPSASDESGHVAATATLARLGPPGEVNGTTVAAGSADDRSPSLTRVTMEAATFDRSSGTSTVELSRAHDRAVGHAMIGPLAGGAQATLDALGSLGIEVPYYLVSAERAPAIPGQPVVVVLAPRRVDQSDGAHPQPIADEVALPSSSAGRQGAEGSGSHLPHEPYGERIGLAGGAEDVAAASRATLNALNRYLATAAGRAGAG